MAITVATAIKPHHIGKAMSGSPMSIAILAVTIILNIIRGN